MDDLRAEILEQAATQLRYLKKQRAENTITDDAFRDQAFSVIDALEPSTSVYQLHEHGLMDTDTWEHVPEQEWLIDDLIPAEPSLIFFYAAPENFKSYILFDLCTALVTGGTFLPPANETYGPGGAPIWAGFHCKREVRILYLALEDTAQRLKLRRAKILEVRQNPDYNGNSVLNFHIAQPIYGLKAWQPVHITNPQHLIAIQSAIATEGYTLIVVDTLRESAQGLNENNSDDVARLIDIAYSIRSLGCSVLFSHHIRKLMPGGQNGSTPDRTHGDEMRGSSALAGAADVLLSSQIHDAEESTIRFVVKKAKDVAATKRIDALVRPQGDDFYRPECLGYFLWLNDLQEARIVSAQKSADRKQKIYEIIRDGLEIGQQPNFSEIARQLKVHRSTVTRAVQSLVGEKLANVEGKGYENLDK